MALQNLGLSKERRQTLSMPYNQVGSAIGVARDDVASGDVCFSPTLLLEHQVRVHDVHTQGGAYPGRNTNDSWVTSISITPWEQGQAISNLHARMRAQCFVTKSSSKLRSGTFFLHAFVMEDVILCSFDAERVRFSDCRIVVARLQLGQMQRTWTGS